MVNKWTLLLLLLVVSPARAEFFGVQVLHYNGSVVRQEPGEWFREHDQKITVLAVYPQPTSNGLFTGVESEILSSIIREHGLNGAHAISHYFMKVIQDSYFKIGEERGVFKVGDKFQTELQQKEPFWDGRSAALAVFEGTDFSRPVATFRVAYSTPQHPLSPLEHRTHIHIQDLRNDSPVVELAESDLHTLGLNFMDQGIARMFADNAMGSNTPGGLLFGHILKLASQGIPTGHRYLFGGQLYKFESVLKAAAQQLGRPVRVGGHPAELKGLSHYRNDRRTNYMRFAINLAIELGYFELVPYVNGYNIPMSFVAEAAEDHLKNEYKDWNFKLLKTYWEAARGKNGAVVEFQRQDLGKLVPLYFSRANPWVVSSSAASDRAFDELLGMSEAETLRLSPNAPPLRVDGAAVRAHCAKVLSNGKTQGQE